MKTNKFMTSLNRGLHMTGLKLKKHSPEIAVGVGIVCGVASTIFACKATLKVNEVLDDTKKSIEKIHTATETGKTEAGKDYSIEDSKKDLTITYVQTGVKLVKLYAPAVLFGAAAIGCVVGGHKVLKKENLALAATAAGLDKSFKEYRGRVVERFGKDLDRELKFGLKAKEIEETIVNEDGTETVVKKTVNVIDEYPNHSPYSIFFDDGNTGWDKDPEVSKFFLIQQQNFLNEKLNSEGVVFLNDVYKALGARITQAGQTVGWYKGSGRGDDYIDFGMFDSHNRKAREFINGYERVIILDFNCYPIVDLI